MCACVLRISVCARIIGIYLNCEPVGVRGQVVYMQHVSAVRPSARHVPAAACVCARDAESIYCI